MDELPLVKYSDMCHCTVPNDGCLNFVDENDEVLLAGFGRKGKAKGDIPGVRFKVVKVSGVGLSAYAFPVLLLDYTNTLLLTSI